MRALFLLTTAASLMIAAPAWAEPSFSIDNAIADEDSRAITFNVRKHGTPNDQPSKVIVYAIPGTAKGGLDYFDDAFLLSFSALEFQKTVTFELINDATPESSESFTAKLIRGANARLHDGRAIGAIRDSDAAPPPSQTCPDGSVIPATSACPPPSPPPISDNVQVSEGDSNSVFWAGNHTGMYADSRPAITFLGRAVGGSGLTSMCDRLAAMTESPELVSIMIGANGITAQGSPQGFLDKLWSCTDPLRARGIKVAVSTILPQYRAASPDTEAIFEGYRLPINAGIRGAVGVHVDAAPDLGGDPLLGPLPAARDPALFTDGTHLTRIGHTRILEIVAPHWDRLLGITSPAAPPSVAQTCPDGTVILASLACPPSWVPTPAVGPIASIPSNFDFNSQIEASSGIPGSAAPDVVGAFRFICNAGQLLRDDPVAYPNQPGVSHLHQFFGNTGADARSTYKSLRETGDSTCMSPLNRSGYWMPAMLDGKGMVVRPDWVSIYYKRRPASDPKCSLTSGDPKALGNCVPLPNGLRFIFGYDMITATTPTGFAYFNCQGKTAVPGHYPDLTNVTTWCPTAPNADGSYNQLGAVISAPQCWDGKNLDSPNHRAHVSYPSYGSWGFQKCPPTHPSVIPTFTMGAWFTVDANLGTWRLSSDEMHPNLPRGTTFHADWFGAWDNEAQDIWHGNCIDKLLNCAAGNLGNGQRMKQFPGFSWFASPRLVPIPAQ